MLVKFHENVVAVCDTNLLGKTFTEGKLELKVSESFYGGEEKSEKELTEILLRAHNINLVGEKSVALAIKLKLLNEGDVLKIQKVPHAQIFAIKG
ncbi:DUF424 family protein [Candidatus Woesearchaeota archaeon]|nr:DUF424 family protein [Candidatus Woesearchaeota archaeon]